MGGAAEETKAPTTDGADESTESTDSTSSDGGTTVNTGGGDAVVNEAPDGGGVDVNASDSGADSGESTGGDNAGGDSSE